jgi:hypothetical protein
MGRLGSILMAEPHWKTQTGLGMSGMALALFIGAGTDDVLVRWPCAAWCLVSGIMLARGVWRGSEWLETWE